MTYHIQQFLDNKFYLQEVYWELVLISTSFKQNLCLEQSSPIQDCYLKTLSVCICDFCVTIFTLLAYAAFPMNGNTQICVYPWFLCDLLKTTVWD